MSLDKQVTDYYYYYSYYSYSATPPIRITIAHFVIGSDMNLIELLNGMLADVPFQFYYAICTCFDPEYVVFAAENFA
jgi:hypothetical protein